MNISEPWIEPGTWSDDGYLGKHRVELLPGAIVSSLWQKLFDLLPDLILIQMPAVVIVNAGAGSRVRCTCEYTHIHTPTLNDRHSQACNETYADKIKNKQKKHTRKSDQNRTNMDNFSPTSTSLPPHQSLYIHYVTLFLPVPNSHSNNKINRQRPWEMEFTFRQPRWQNIISLAQF